MQDPRTSRRYKNARTIWLRQSAGTTCALCGGTVNLDLPGMSAHGPTIEHTLPIRTIIATATSYEHAVALCCDTTLWALAHRRCQARQGAHAVNSARQGRTTASRQW